MRSQKEHVKAFMKKHKDEVKLARDRVYVNLHRHFRTPEDFFKYELDENKDMKNTKLVYPK